MGRVRTATSIPKRALIDAIIRVIPAELIASQLHISPDTELKQRLSDFTKAELLAVITLTPEGERALIEAERNYPLASPPTLYLVKVLHRPDPARLAEQTAELVSLGRAAAMQRGTTQAIRAVYVATSMHRLDINDQVTEFALFYERRLEYAECEPTSEDFGERKALYSLEQALVWLIEDHTHAMICCTDFAAVRPIIDFGALRLGISWALPDLTEEMLDRLAADSRPRTVTFSTSSADLGFLDIQTVTVSDPFLMTRKGYRQIREDPNRERTAGFFTSHPDVAFGGLGIARRYGRVWTPAHLSRRRLVALAIGLVERTERELSQELERDPERYVRYFRNAKVKIADRELKGKERDAFEKLTTGVLRATRAPTHETSLDARVLHQLVECQEGLHISIALQLDCENCGPTLALCPKCRLPYSVQLIGGSITLRCPNSHCGRMLDMDEGIECDCGTATKMLALENHLWMLPSPELLAGLRDHLDGMDVAWTGLFYINGHTLKLLSTVKVQIRPMIQLGDLRCWRVRAHHAVRALPRSQDRLLSILNIAKEKCQKNNGHPTHGICAQCIKEKLSASQIRAGETCLPRMFGAAIDEKFDGIHHGREIADVKYEDILDETGQALRIGVHLKSRVRPRRQGLGRSVEQIKALYTQLFYSAYVAHTGAAKFDVLGISIPNAIHPEVLSSMQSLVNQLGFSFLVVEENDWLRIAAAALEQAELEVNSPHRKSRAGPS